MKTFRMITAVACVATLLTADLRAQVKIQVQPANGIQRLQIAPGGFARIYRPGISTLIRLKAVQDELKLDEEQKKDIDDKWKDWQKGNQGLGAAIRNAKPAERQKAIQQYLKKQQERREKLDKELRGLLTPPQQKRIDEIALQRQGLNAFRNPDVIKKLNITDDQTKDIADVQKEITEKRRQLVQDVRNGNLERGKLQEKYKELNTELEKKTLEVLTKEQREQFEKMKGKPFQFQQRRLRPRAVPAKRLKLQAKPIRIKGKVRQIKPAPRKPNAPKNNNEKKKAE